MSSANADNLDTSVLTGALLCFKQSFEWSCHQFCQASKPLRKQWLKRLVRLQTIPAKSLPRMPPRWAMPCVKALHRPSVTKRSKRRATCSKLSIEEGGKQHWYRQLEDASWCKFASRICGITLPDNISRLAEGARRRF